MAKLVGTPLDFRGNGISNVGGISAPNGTSGQCFAADGTLKDIPSIDGTVKYIVVDVDNTGKTSTEGGDTMLHPNQFHAMYCIGGSHVQTYKYNDEGSAIGIRVLDDGAVESGNTKLVTGGTVYDAINNATGDLAKQSDLNDIGDAVNNLDSAVTDTSTKVDNLGTQVSGLATRVGKVENAQAEYILTYPASDTAATSYYSHDGQRRKLTIISYKGTGTIQVTLPQSPSDGQRIEVFKRGTSNITFKRFSTSSDYTIDVMEVIKVISTDASNDLTPIAADTDFTMKGGSYLVMIYSSALKKWVGKEIG